VAALLSAGAEMGLYEYSSSTAWGAWGWAVDLVTRGRCKTGYHPPSAKSLRVWLRPLRLNGGTWTFIGPLDLKADQLRSPKK